MLTTAVRIMRDAFAALAFRRREVARTLNVVLLLLAIAICVLLWKKSLNFIEVMPPQGVDDSIPNVAVSLVEHLRLGFLSSPIQGAEYSDRTHAFFNYGPLYFYVAAALTWLLEPSFLLYRALHPIGLIVVVLIAAFAFRRRSWVGVAVLAAGILHVYLVHHWPLARPDIMVSVCVAMMLFFAERAIRMERPFDWLGVGFFAASATTSHNIAAAMVPAAGLIWLLSLPLGAAGNQTGSWFRRGSTSLAAVAIGGMLGALVFLVAIDFRIRALFSLGSHAVSIFYQGFFANLAGHYTNTWSYIGQSAFNIALAGFVLAGALALLGYFLPVPYRRNVVALVVPPMVATVLYQVSIGLYGNQHFGYYILSHVTTLWAGAAGVAAVVWAVEERFPRLGTGMHRLAALGIIALVFWQLRYWVLTPNNWEMKAQGAVAFPEYVNRVLEPIPPRASAAGSLEFGLEGGKRVDLVQLFAANAVNHTDYTVEDAKQIRPEFLILGSYEMDLDSVRTLISAPPRVQSHAGSLRSYFPDARFRLTRLVYAPPYGSARVYQLDASTKTEESSLPSIAVSDGVSRQWSSQLGPVFPVKFKRTNPVVADLSIYSLQGRTTAVETQVADLPAGFYLVVVETGNPGPDIALWLIATPGPFFHWRGGWTDFAMPATEVLEGERPTTLLVDHLGGPLYLSKFLTTVLPLRSEGGNRSANAIDKVLAEMGALPIDKGGQQKPPAVKTTALHVLSVQRVNQLADDPARKARIDLPSPAQWTPQNPKISLSGLPDGHVRLAGPAKAHEWLVKSPFIAVQPGRRYVLTFPTETFAAAIQVGVLGASDWVAPPTLMPRRVAFNAGRNGRVQVVITGASVTFPEPLNVVLRSPTLVSADPGELYVDRLMGCRPYASKRTDLQCSDNR